MMTDEIAQATPAQIDTEIFPLWAKRWLAADRALQERYQIGLAIWPGAAKIRRGGLRERSYIMFGRDLQQAFDRMGKYELERRFAEDALAPLEAEYDRRPWSRYVLVGRGHLHKPGCHTLKPTTQRLLLAESSGLTDDEVVARYSYTACTHCFPDAPVAPAEVDPDVCAGSGVYVPSTGLRYAACPVCGDVRARTPHGKMPKHKTKAPTT